MCKGAYSADDGFYFDLRPAWSIALESILDTLSPHMYLRCGLSEQMKYVGATALDS
jgi:hypothetical protein